MALHGKTAKAAKQQAAHASKPSRIARLQRRWDARLGEMARFFAARDADHARAFRIVEYLARRKARVETMATAA